MLSYWKKDNGQLRQIESEDTPTLLEETIDSIEWYQITKSEYDSLLTKEDNYEYQESIKVQPIQESDEISKAEPVITKDTTEERYF